MLMRAQGRARSA